MKFVHYTLGDGEGGEETKNTHRKMEANLHTAQALQFSDERRNEFEEFHSVVVVSIRRLNTLSNTSAAIAHPLALSPSLSFTLHYASHQVHQWRENHPNLARFQNELIRKVWLRNSKKVWLRARENSILKAPNFSPKPFDYLFRARNYRNSAPRE